MAKQISNLSIKLSLSGEQLRQGTSRATKTLNEFGAKARSVGKPIGGLQSKFGNLNGIMSGFAASLGGPVMAGLAAAAAAALSFQSILNGVSAAFSRVDVAAKQAATLGTTVNSMEALSLAAERGGTDFATMRSSLAKMLDTLSEASTGTKSANDAFDELGLSARDLSSLTADEAFQRIAASIQSVESPADRIRLSMDIFGRQARKLQVTMAGLAKTGMEPLREEMRALGALSGEDAAAIEEMNDAWTEFNTAIGGVFNQVAAAVAPVLEDLLREILIPMLKAVIELSRWWRELFGADPAAMAGAMDETKKAAEAGAASSSKWAEEQAKIVEETKKLKEAEAAAAKEQDKMAASASSLVERLKTPMEKLNDEADRFRELWALGLVPIETAGRAMDDLAKRMADAEVEAMGVSDRISSTKTPTIGAAIGGTTAALNIVAQLQNAGRDRAEAERADRRRELELARRSDDKLREIEKSLSRIERKESVALRTTKIIG